MATHNHVFSLSGDIIKNRNVGLYLVATMSYMKKLFSYNNMGTWSKIKEQYITLPVTKSKDIDFDFMASRIRELEASRIRELEAYLKVAGFDDCELTEEENEAVLGFHSKKSAKIEIGTLFDIRKGTRLTKGNMRPGTINFVGSTSNNNGITAKIANTSNIHKGNLITVTYNGSVGEAFYQADSFWASDDVNVLYSKQYAMNELLGLYICTSLRMLGKKYCYNYKWTKDLMGKDEIFLPLTSSGSVDYHFMETYIRAIEKLTIKKVKDWRAKEIEAAKTVVNNTSNIVSLQPQYDPKPYPVKDDDYLMMVADDAIPYGKNK